MNTTDPVDLEALRGHTPGPWFIPSTMGSHGGVVHASGYVCFTAIPRNVDEARQPGESWIDMRARTQQDRDAIAVEESTNARLIASAPALLAELTARRARDAEVAVLIASELARIDGYDPEDQHGGLYDLRWSGGPNPEPEGDAWHMDYLPKGERIAAILAGAKP